MAVSRNRLLDADNFLLGTFASNCSGGMSVTKVPERWDNSWANNLRLAKLLDNAGIDFMLRSRAGSVMAAKPISMAVCSKP